MHTVPSAKYALVLLSGLSLPPIMERALEREPDSQRENCTAVSRSAAGSADVTLEYVQEAYKRLNVHCEFYRAARTELVLNSREQLQQALRNAYDCEHDATLAGMQTEQLEKRIAENETRIAVLDRDYAELEKKVQDLGAVLTRHQNELINEQKRCDENTAKRKALEEKIKTLDERVLAPLRDKAKQLESECERLLQELWKRGIPA